MPHGRASNETTTVSLAGDVSQGVVIDRRSAGEPVMLPQSTIDAGDLVFRARSDIHAVGIDAGDLLIVEPRSRGHAATAELVIVTVDDRAFIGHWWNKRGRRALMDDELAPITDDAAMRILGAITLIVRTTPQPAHRPKR